MGPHDLLCKWCSTFVGQGQKFCSIFCESRFTRNRRRRLAFRRYPSDTQGNNIQEFVSPRESKFISNQKENPLEDIVTALHMENDKMPPDKPRAKLDGDLVQTNGIAHTQARGELAKLGSMSRLPTRTKSDFHKQDSKIPVRIRNRIAEDSDNTLKDKYDLNQDNTYKHEQFERTTSLATMTSEMTIQTKRTRTAVELSKRVRSSGYGQTVNPKLRPMALKPRSASKPTNMNQRESSAKSKSSAKAAVTVQDLFRDNSKPIITGKEDQKWEIIPSTVDEDTHRSSINLEPDNIKDSLEGEDPLTPKESPKTAKYPNRETARSELVKIEEILREESTSSDLLDQSILQERLSSIKRKVEYKRRGLDSRSSMGSDFDAFMDSTLDLTTERDVFNASLGASKDKRNSRLSTRTPATKTSREYRI